MLLSPLGRWCRTIAARLNQHELAQLARRGALLLSRVGVGCCGLLGLRFCLQPALSTFASAASFHVRDTDFKPRSNSPGLAVSRDPLPSRAASRSGLVKCPISCYNSGPCPAPSAVEALSPQSQLKRQISSKWQWLHVGVRWEWARSARKMLRQSEKATT